MGKQLVPIFLHQYYFRDRQIKEIEASFEACKSRPVHATNKSLYPVEVLPLLPDFDRYGTIDTLFLILVEELDYMYSPMHETCEHYKQTNQGRAL